MQHPLFYCVYKIQTAVRTLCFGFEMALLEETTIGECWDCG